MERRRWRPVGAVAEAFRRVRALGLTQEQVSRLCHHYLNLPVGQRHLRWGVSHPTRTAKETPDDGVGVAGWILDLDATERERLLSEEPFRKTIHRQMDVEAEAAAERSAIQGEPPSQSGEELLSGARKAALDYIRRHRRR